jgi:biopolymer transport protein ExbD
MNFTSHRRPAPTINLSALIDIIFILLIFVVLAANFDRLRDLDVSLPSARGTGKADPKALVVTVPQEGPLRIDGKELDAANLEQHLRTLRATHESLLIAADGQVALERAVQVLSSASSAGFQSVSIATQEPSP